MGVEWVVFHITNRCQLNCKHCLRDPEKNALDIEVGVVERVLDDAIRFYGCHHVGLTGGEPTLHPQFLPIVDAIVDRGRTWHMVTNGIRFESRVIAPLLERPKRKEAVTAIDFSVDGATEEVHDRIRGEGSFRELMRAVTLAKFNDIPFSFQMTLNAYNAHELEPLAMMGAELGAGRVSFGMTQATGTYLDAEMYLSRGELDQLKARIERLQGMMRMPIAHAEGFRSPHAFHLCEPFKSDILHIDYNGVMNLCCQHAGVPGSNGSSDALADLKTTSILDGHRRMLATIQKFHEDKLAAIEAGALGPWDHYPCNYCMKYFGKPHWDEHGAAGAPALRPRWRGAWAPERHEGTSIPVSSRLPILRDPVKA